MPKSNNFKDAQLNDEFDNIYQKLDLYVVSQTQPTNPKVGMMWFSPSAGTLKIWDGTQFRSF